MDEPVLLLPLTAPPGRLVRPADETLHRLDGKSMGTSWTLQLVGDIDPGEIAERVEAELAAVIREMSQWEPFSALSCFNRAPVGSWHTLAPGFFQVMEAALQLAQRTDGAFDPTLGELSEMWGFGASPAPTLPPAAADIDAALGRCGWRKLELDAENRRLRQPGGLRLDLSGIAKGHAVDRVVSALMRAGCVSFLVEIGGEVAARGLKPDGHPWWVDIEMPPGAQLPPVRVGLLDLSAATSGDYRRYHTSAKGRLAHTLDPRTGQPLARPPASVTVLDKGCMHADALATALTVLGVNAGLDLANELQVAAVFVSETQGLWRCDLSEQASAMAR